MKIGDLASRTGLNTSAIRYYESVGLLPAPHRSGGQRRYPDDAVHRVLLIRFARNMGFTLGEIKLFLSGLRENTPVGPHWKKLAHRKIKEVEEIIERSLQLKSLLQHLLQCHCASLQVCVERLSLRFNNSGPKGGRQTRQLAPASPASASCRVLPVA
jgi:MerR family transcriptional regulator, redox-sensitive transcriptional activator SoxR